MHLLLLTAALLVPADGVPNFVVRPGYAVTVAADVGALAGGEARFLETDDDGTLYVSQPRAGKILAFTDADGDGVYEKQATFAEGYDGAHGMDFNDGELWFTAAGAIYRAADADNDGVADEVVTVLEDLPAGGGHWWRSICVSGDHFFTSIGDSSNLTPEEYPLAEDGGSDRQKIWRYNLDGTGKSLWSTGIRNTEKLQIRPETDELWGADHGSDNFGKPIGDDKDAQPVTNLNPPEEFNHYVEGGFYGHPFITGKNLPRYEYTKRKDIIDLAGRNIPPAYEGGAHWANNGFTFVTDDAFNDHPDGAMAGDALIAYHGSWNRKPVSGYRVQRVLFDPHTNGPIGGYPLVETLRGEERLGRPVDVTMAPDGTILFSCDMTNKVYRISPAK